jgi:hypothetical protein
MLVIFPFNLSNNEFNTIYTILCGKESHLVPYARSRPVINPVLCCMHRLEQ